jgi:hypothetical protein
MTAADGQAAIDAHWARDPTEALYEHDELDEAHRKEAWDASHAWAQAQWDAAANIEPPPVEPPPEEGAAHKRGMAAAPGGTYTTRQK